MNELLAPITGKIKLQIHGKEYEFKNTVSVYFDYLQHAFLSVLGLTNEPSGPSIPINAIRYSIANGFSLVEEAPSTDEQIAYTELAYVPLSAFRVVKASLKETVLRASATIDAGGTIRAGGFNIMRKVPRAVVLPNTTRKITLPVTVHLNVPTTLPWFYHPTVKAFYLFGQGSIYKLPFDIDNGTFGSVQVVSTNWASDTSQMASDGENRMFGFDSANLMKIFDCLTDTVTDVPLSASIEYWNRGTRYWAWDDVNKVFRCPHPMYLGGIGSVGGVTIDANGTITINTGTLNIGANLRRFRKDLIVGYDSYWSYDPVPVKLGSFLNSDEIQYCDRAFMQNDVFIYATFDSSVPTYVTLNICKMPETYLSIASVTPPIPVVRGDSFSIEYSFITGL